MRFEQTQIAVTTSGQGLYDITPKLIDFRNQTGIRTGQLTAYCRHTSASLLVQENADPDVTRDLLAFFHRLVPDGDPLFVHTLEGPDDMPSHVKAALTQTSITIPIVDAALALGTWQGLYVFEHRSSPHMRNVVLSVVGD